MSSSAIEQRAEGLETRALTLPPKEVLSRRFHLVTGKGGVGKSTVSVTLALSLAAQGKRVLICEVDERDQLAHSFGVEPSQGALRALELSELSGEVWGVNMQLNSALSEYGELKLKVRALSQLFTDNPLTRALLSVIPGVGDLIYLGKAFHHEREQTRAGGHAWDAVVLDAPATGHGLTFLGLPKLIGELVPIGNLKRESDEMWALLSDPSRSALHVVTRPEALPTQEALELTSQLRDELGLSVDTLWLNLCAPHLSLEQLLSADNERRAAPALWTELRARCDELLAGQRAEWRALETLSEAADQLSIPVARLSRLTLAQGSRPLVDALLREAFSCTLSGPPERLRAQERSPPPAPRLTFRATPQRSGARLITLVGGGGVGKTTMSAALALAHAMAGERVALITIDPARRLAQALGLSELSGNLSEVPLHPRLDAMMLERSLTAQRLVERYSSSEEVSERLAAHPYFKAFSGSLAGAQEYMALHEVSLALDSGQYDVVVLDTPPGRHALDFLDAPARLTSAIQSPALTLLSKASGGRIGGGLVIKAFGKLTSSVFVSELTSFLSLFMDILRGLERDGVRLIERCHHGDFVLITTPDELPTRVAEQARRSLESRGMSPRGLIINRTTTSPTPELRALSVRLDEGGQRQLEALLAHQERVCERARRAEQTMGAQHPQLAALERLDMPELSAAGSAARVEALATRLLRSFESN